jgi:HD-GYP domain-containing protein (c-di-GMP phosphodiesterase class II)
MNDSNDVLQVAAERAGLIEQLLAIGAALSSATDLEELLSLILTKSREITYSDAGSVYLVDHSKPSPCLVFKVAQNFSQPTASFREFAMPLTPHSLAGYVALTGQTLNLPDAYQLPPEVPYQLDQSFDRALTYRTRSVLVLPMQNQQGDTLGVLQLINRKLNNTQRITPQNVLAETQPFSGWEEKVLHSLASQAAISIERNQLQESIENLFEGFVRASVQIIEARDPCTSGHSERVADLTVRLSQEVSYQTQGALARIQFSPRQIQEIRYAALLHDFGKVGVPESILGKAEKLYPMQIEVIRQRFALARRTLEAECAQAKYHYVLNHLSHFSQSLALSTQLLHPAETRAVDSEHSTATAHAATTDPPCAYCQTLDHLDLDLEHQITRLDRYWDVLLQANQPQILAEEPMAQLKELADYTFRTVDNTQTPLLTPQELEQLLVCKGSLTDLERQAIQSHVTHTYEFLKRIPWTKDLQDVPEIAFGHHEKLDGSGYPRGLKAQDIPIQAQIMAIADIYDALTAGDRPYKRGLAPGAALRILMQEVQQQKLNAELVLLFQHRQVFSVLGHTCE